MPLRQSWATIIAQLFGNKPNKAGKASKTASTNSLDKKKTDSASEIKGC